jgi:threonine/homoserine/homoserine lactone efflux protein
MNIVADMVKVLMAGRIRQKLTPHNISVINKISGTILMVFGAALIYGIAVLKHKVG